MEHGFIELRMSRGGVAGVLALVACTATLAHGAPTASHLRQPLELRCQGESAPLAIATPRPEFSWQLAAASDALHGVIQSAYRIQVAAGESGFVSQRGIIWDSGEVKSRSALGIEYGGPALEAGHEYLWRVEAWDDQHLPSGWSEEAHWRQAPAWRAGWIAAQAEGNSKKDDPMPLFRKTFKLDRPVARATLYASGLGQDELRINGGKVGNDELTPGWSDYRKTVFYDSYDVTAMLRPGNNALGAMLGNGMYRVLKTSGRYTKFVGSFGDLKCSVQLEIEFAGGGSAEILSDGSWRTAPGPVVFSSTYGGEDYDARREPRGWDEASFDDSHWSTAVVVDGPAGTLTPELAPPIRALHTYDPVNIVQPKPGVTVYDLGQNFAGWPEIAVEGSAGATVKLIPGEQLHPDGTVWQRSSGGPQWFSYTLRGGGTEHWHPRFSYYGFRYVQVEVSGDAKLASLRGVAVHSSSAQTGEFASSDEQLNRIHQLILRAIENNAESLFTDCPHREKLGWLEETHLMAPSLLYDFDFAGLYAATMRNIGDAQPREGAKAGMVPEIAPQYMVFDPEKYDIYNDSPEWGSAAVLAPWAVFERTGDRGFLAAQYATMQRYVAYLGTRAHNGIVDYGLGDWYDIGPAEPGVSQLTTAGVTGTATYYQDLRVMEKTAALLGHKEESAGYARRAEEVRAAFNARFFDGTRRIYDKGSQTAQAIPLALGLVSDDARAAVMDALVADIRAHQNHTTSGEVGFHYGVDALLDGGRSDVLLDMLERNDAPSYGYILAQGATALTESWFATHSLDHFMLGSAEEWFYRGLGGINVDLTGAGAEPIALRPAVVGNLEWTRARYASALGPIESRWRREKNEMVYEFAVPANATAAIAVDATGAATVNGTEPTHAAGVLSANATGGKLTLKVGSGNYRIRVVNPKP
jgi:hypothetical protein